MTTSIQITALDGIVHTNSLFAFAVFLGLTWKPRDPTNTLISDAACTPDPYVNEDMIAFHVYSFSSFLFSSLVALGLKQAIRLSKNSYQEAQHLQGVINKGLLRVGMLVSGLSSVSGSLFLMLFLINVVQIKLGTLSCESGSGHSLAAIVPLVILVPLALLIYISVVLFAFFQS